MEKWQTELQRQVAEIITNWTHSTRILKKIKINSKQAIDFSKKINEHFNNKDLILDNLDRQLHFILNSLGEIAESKNAYLISDILLRDLSQEVASLQSSTKNFYSVCNSINNRDKNREPSIDSNLIIGYKIKNTSQAIDLNSNFIRIAESTDALINTSSIIAYIIKKEEAPTSQIYTKEMEEIFNQIKNMQSSLGEEYKISKPLYEEIRQLHQQAIIENEKMNTYYQEIKNLLSEITQFSSTFVKDKAAIEDRRAEIMVISDSAEKLRTKINSHESELEEADKIFLKRDEEQKKLDANIKNTLEKLKTYGQSADIILGKITAAGLAKNFRAREKTINQKLNWAQWWHLGSLIFFILYTVFLVFDFFNLFDSGIHANIVSFESLFLKSSLLLPVLLLLTFTNRRYKELFKLKEHYAYKDSIASSIPGFKQESGDYKDLVATTLFSKLTFNPADDIGKAKEKNGDILAENEPLHKTTFDVMEEKIKETAKKMKPE